MGWAVFFSDSCTCYLGWFCVASVEGSWAGGGEFGALVGHLAGVGGGVLCGSVGAAGVAEGSSSIEVELFYDLPVDRWPGCYRGAVVLLASLPLAGCGVIVRVAVRMLRASKILRRCLSLADRLDASSRSYEYAIAQHAGGELFAAGGKHIDIFDYSGWAEKRSS